MPTRATPREVAPVDGDALSTWSKPGRDGVASARTPLTPNTERGDHTLHVHKVQHHLSSRGGQLLFTPAYPPKTNPFVKKQQMVNVITIS